LIALFDRIPCAIEQGKFSAEQGIDLSEQGILIRDQRKPAWIAAENHMQAPSIAVATQRFLQSD